MPRGGIHLGENDLRVAQDVGVWTAGATPRDVTPTSDGKAFQLHFDAMARTGVGPADISPAGAAPWFGNRDGGYQRP